MVNTLYTYDCECDRCGSRLVVRRASEPIQDSWTDARCGSYDQAGQPCRGHVQYFDVASVADEPADGELVARRELFRSLFRG
jgi:hypothetical protein